MWELQRKNLGQFISENYLKLFSTRQREAAQFIPGAYEQGMHLSEPEATQPKKLSWIHHLKCVDIFFSFSSHIVSIIKHLNLPFICRYDKLSDNIPHQRIIALLILKIIFFKWSSSKGFRKVLFLFYQFTTMNIIGVSSINVARM